jgi:hypothetical protein
MFRELVGEHFDCPVGYILSTKALPDIVSAARPDLLADLLESELNRGRRPEKRIGREFVAEKLRKAREAAAAETSAVRADASRRI